MTVKYFITKRRISINQSVNQSCTSENIYSVSSTNKTHRHDITESGVQTCNLSFGSLIYKEHLSKLQEQCSQYDL